jgi:hypothetical protein
VADDAINNRIGTMLEELGARFELVIEAVTSYGGRLDALRAELLGQFAEVGSQIRFLSEQIGENRKGIAAMRSDLGAEMIRLGETLGRTRVEFREQIGAVETSLRQRPESEAAQLRKLARDAALVAVESSAGHGADASAATREEIRRGTASTRQGLDETGRTLRREITTSAENTGKRLASEIGKTNKALQTLARKFDRFDDRITVAARDQDQRLRKLERKARG